MSTSALFYLMRRANTALADGGAPSSEFFTPFTASTSSKFVEITTTILRAQLMVVQGENISFVYYFIFIIFIIINFPLSRCIFSTSSFLLLLFTFF